MSDENSAGYSLANPFGKEESLEFVVPGQIGYQPGLYEQTLAAGYALHVFDLRDRARSVR